MIKGFSIDYEELTLVTSLHTKTGHIIKPPKKVKQYQTWFNSREYSRFLHLLKATYPHRKTIILSWGVIAIFKSPEAAQKHYEELKKSWKGGERLNLPF